MESDAQQPDESWTIAGALRGVLLRLVRLLPGTFRPMRFFRPKAIASEGVVKEVRTHGLLRAVPRILPGIAGNIATGTALFASYEEAHRRTAGSHRDAALCGAFSGAVHAAIACPIEALLAGRWHRPFAALGVFLVRDTVGFGAFFAAFDVLLLKLRPAQAVSPASRVQELGASVAAGGIAGGIYHLWSAPFHRGRTHANPSFHALLLEFRRVGLRAVLSGARSSAGGAVVASSLSFFVAQTAVDSELRKALLAETWRRTGARSAREEG